MTPPLNTSRKRFGAFTHEPAPAADVKASPQRRPTASYRQRYSAWLRPQLPALSWVFALAVVSSELIHAAIARPSPSTNCSQRCIVASLRK